MIHGLLSVIICQQTDLKSYMLWIHSTVLKDGMFTAMGNKQHKDVNHLIIQCTATTPTSKISAIMHPRLKVFCAAKYHVAQVTELSVNILYF